MKYLSGDFISQYNKILNEYVERQKTLDTEIDRRMQDIIAVEKNRLQDNNPSEFKPGTQVKVVGDEAEGTVEKSELYFDPFKEEVVFGPGRYYEIKNGSDEEVITCEGSFWNVYVRMAKTPLHEDWGAEGQLIEYFEDEIERVD